MDGLWRCTSYKFPGTLCQFLCTNLYEGRWDREGRGQGQDSAQGAWLRLIMMHVFLKQMTIELEVLSISQCFFFVSVQAVSMLLSF